MNHLPTCFDSFWPTTQVRLACTTERQLTVGLRTRIWCSSSCIPGLRHTNASERGMPMTNTTSVFSSSVHLTDLWLHCLVQYIVCMYLCCDELVSWNKSLYFLSYLCTKFCFEGSKFSIFRQWLSNVLIFFSNFRRKVIVVYVELSNNLKKISHREVRL